MVLCVMHLYWNPGMCPCHLKASLTMWNRVLLHCFTVKTCVQIFINPCLVAAILKEDRCGIIVAELGTLMMVGSSDWLFCVVQVTIVFDQIKSSQQVFLL